MTRFLLGRVAQTLLSMLVVISIVFVLARMSGNPIDLLLDANATDQERVRIMRDEMGPWMQDYVPGIAIGAAHAIGGLGPQVGEWPIIPGHMGFHNWEYVTRK